MRYNPPAFEQTIAESIATYLSDNGFFVTWLANTSFEFTKAGYSGAVAELLALEGAIFVDFWVPRGSGRRLIARRELEVADPDLIETLEELILQHIGCRP